MKNANYSVARTAVFVAVSNVLMWAVCWLLYDFANLFFVISIMSYQNILLILFASFDGLVATLTLSAYRKAGVVPTGPGPAPETTKSSGLTAKERIAILEEKLLTTKPDSPERKEIAKKIMDLEATL